MIECGCAECVQQVEENWRGAVAHLHVLLMLLKPQDRTGEIENFCNCWERSEVIWGPTPEIYLL